MFTNFDFSRGSRNLFSPLNSVLSPPLFRKNGESIEDLAIDLSDGFMLKCMYEALADKDFGRFKVKSRFTDGPMTSIWLGRIGSNRKSDLNVFRRGFSDQRGGLVPQ